MPEKRDQRTSEELISELLIANHNLTSCLRRMQENGRTEEMNELYKLFEEHFENVKKELFRRLDFYERCQK